MVELAKAICGDVNVLKKEKKKPNIVICKIALKDIQVSDAHADIREMLTTPSPKSHNISYGLLSYCGVNLIRWKCWCRMIHRS